MSRRLFACIPGGILRPVRLYVDRTIPGKAADIYNTGNSVVCFAGAGCVPGKTK
ncbi:MAG: hypothetical protein KKH28_06625 [Elusimicrobia bacterium]|nr:hypothetical protein [Elusimicrobiota bacterium]